MKRKESLIFILLFIFLLIMPASSSALWIKLSPKQLEQGAEIILVGYIEGATGKYHYADDIWDTKWKVHVIYYLKGSRPDKDLTVYTPGVKDDNIERSTDFGLDGRGNLVLLFLSKKENRYFPITPQGIIGLQSNRYSKGVLDPPTGVTVLKEYCIKNGQLSREEKKQTEEIIKAKNADDPNKAINQPLQKEKDNYKADKVFYQAVNIFILLLLLTFGGRTFIDCRRRRLSYFSSLFWSLTVVFVIPPVGILIYFFYRRKKWL